jgi:hypothetical protein
MVHITVDELLTTYAVSAAVTHTVMAANWTMRRIKIYVGPDRHTILKNHVWNHDMSIKNCTRDSCPKL